MISRHRKSRAQISLARTISKMGIASRSRAEEMILAGRVTVNGRKATDASIWIDPRSDKIMIDGVAAAREQRVYLALHKPAGVVTTRSDERGRETVYDLLPEKFRWVFPIGRLDLETSGLLLLTNDTRFGEKATNPTEKIAKEYVVTLNAPLGEEHAGMFSSGMTLRDGTHLRKAEVSIVSDDRRIFRMTICEGKNRQIRRMCEEPGYSVISLKRISIGSITLGNLAPGKMRPLTDRERRSIFGDAQ